MTIWNWRRYYPSLAGTRRGIYVSSSNAIPRPVPLASGTSSFDIRWFSFFLKLDSFLSIRERCLYADFVPTDWYLPLRRTYFLRVASQSSPLNRARHRW